MRSVVFTLAIFLFPAVSLCGIAGDLAKLERDVESLEGSRRGEKDPSFLSTMPDETTSSTSVTNAPIDDEAAKTEEEVKAAEADAESAVSSSAGDDDGDNGGGKDEDGKNKKNDPLCAAIKGECMDSKISTHCDGGDYVSGKCKQPHHTWSFKCCVMPPPDLRTPDQKAADANWEFLLSPESRSKRWDFDVPMTFGIPFARKIVTSAQKSEFGAKVVVPAGARNLWADMLMERIREYQAENAMPVDGKLTEGLIEALSKKGPGGTPGMKTTAWGEFWDKRNEEDVKNLHRVREVETAPKGRDLATAIKLFHVGRFGATELRAGDRPATKYGWQFIKNFYETTFTGPNDNDCPRKDESKGCNAQVVSMSMSPAYEKWFPVPNRFFYQTCAPKPSYMKNSKPSCVVGTDPATAKRTSCPDGKTCVNGGAWSYCGIAVTAAVKMATGNKDIRWALGPVGGTPAGYPGSFSQDRKASTTITSIDGLEGPAPGDHMQLAVANSHQDMMWCGTKDMIYTIDSNGWGQETSTNAKARNRQRGNFYGFLRTIPLEEGEAERYAAMDCAQEWSRIVARTARVATILDDLAGRKSPWYESMKKWGFDYPFSKL